MTHYDICGSFRVINAQVQVEKARNATMLNITNL